MHICLVMSAGYVSYVWPTVSVVRQVLRLLSANALPTNLYLSVRLSQVDWTAAADYTVRRQRHSVSQVATCPESSVKTR
jgi:hypothetical protein